METTASAQTSRAPPVRRPIILVHGTWGRGFFPESVNSVGRLRKFWRFWFPPKKGWFEEGSPFRIKIEEELKNAPDEHPIRTFCWSGANSVYARDAAAAELANNLREDLESPGDAAIVIAHSHGGNVALRALHYLNPQQASRVKLVTLATPFLRVFAQGPLKLPENLRSLLWGAVFVAIGIPASVLSVLMLLAVKETIGIEVVNVVGYVVLAVFVAVAVGSIPIARWLTAIFINPPPTGKQRPLELAKAAAYDTRGPLAPRMLVIRGVDDEASLSLAAGSIGSRLTYLTLIGLLPAAYVVGLTLLVVARLLFSPDERTAELLMLVLVYGLCFATLLFLVLPGAFKSAFGREFLIGAMRCEIAADSVPDASEGIEIITLPPLDKAKSNSKRRVKDKVTPSSKLRHKIYNHPECVNEIGRWFRRVP